MMGLAQPPTNRLGIRPGLRRRDFRRIARTGFGDGMNAYAHSMAWFNGHLYVGTTRGTSAVRWGVAGNIVIAWIVTIPASAGIAALAWWLGGAIF